MRYYVDKNAQPNGDHEVHTENCLFLPNSDNRKYLGKFDNCSEALKEAKKTYSIADGCYYCCEPCHKS
jgi:hypothetical protein